MRPQWRALIFDNFLTTKNTKSHENFKGFVEMQLSRWQWISFLVGLAILLLGGILLFRGEEKVTIQAAEAVQSELPELPAGLPARLGDLEFRVVRERRKVMAVKFSTGEQVWESDGLEAWIVPGAAFPLDVSPEGYLWVANVGRKRLEQLDPQSGTFIASWVPAEPFAGCCNPVRFAALGGGRFLTMEKGRRQARLYAPSGELLEIIVPDLSASEFNYEIRKTGNKIYLIDHQSDFGQARIWEFDPHE